MTLQRALLGAVLMALAGCKSREASSPPQPARPAPEIEADAANGQPFRLSNHRGKVVLLTFGYTFCPDVCPLTLSRAKALFRKLSDRADDISLVFISVDPERDTPTRLRDYVAAFDSRFYALSLEPARLRRILQDYNVAALRRNPDPRRYGNRPGGAAGYTLDHTGGYFLIDKAGRLRQQVPHSADVDALQSAVRPLLEENA